MNNKLNGTDIAFEMSKNLQTQKTEEHFHTNKIEVALQCLNKAAELLDNMNAFGASEVVTKIIERVSTRK